MDLSLLEAKTTIVHLLNEKSYVSSRKRPTV